MARPNPEVIDLVEDSDEEEHGGHDETSPGPHVASAVAKNDHETDEDEASTPFHVARAEEADEHETDDDESYHPPSAASPVRNHSGRSSRIGARKRTPTDRLSYHHSAEDTEEKQSKRQRTSLDKADFVGKELVRQWIDMKGQRRAMYGKVIDCQPGNKDTSDSVVVEYSRASISNVTASSPEWPVPKCETITKSLALGCIEIFNKKHGVAARKVSSDETAWKWLLPDSVQEVCSDPPKKTLTFASFVLHLEARPSEIPSAGLGVFLRVEPLREESGITSFVLGKGELLDLGVYSPLSSDDLRNGHEAICKSFLFDGELDSWAFRFMDDVENLIFDITDNTTGKLHDMAKSRTLTYVNETDGEQLPTIQALRDPLLHVHYLLGPSEDQESLSIPYDKWMELKVDYGSAYEPVRKRKGYSRTSPNTPETQAEQRLADKVTTLEDIRRNWTLEEIQTALSFIERLDLSAMGTHPLTQALLLLFFLSNRLWHLKSCPDSERDDQLDSAWTLIYTVCALVPNEDLQKKFRDGMDGRALRNFLDLNEKENTSTSPSFCAVLSQLRQCGLPVN